MRIQKHGKRHRGNMEGAENDVQMELDYIIFAENVELSLELKAY